MSRYARVLDEVYCHTHGCIHEDDLDPYREGEPTCYAGEFGLTRRDVHRPVYYREYKGDEAYR